MKQEEIDALLLEGRLRKFSLLQLLEFHIESQKSDDHAALEVTNKEIERRDALEAHRISKA